MATGPFDITDQDWSELPATAPIAAVTGDHDTGAYHGRRRLAGGPRNLLTLRRVSVIALAVGVLLIGAGMLVRMLGSSSDPVVAPPPTPQLEAGPVDEELGRLGDGPTPSAPPSPAATTSPPVQTDAFEAEVAELGSRGQVVPLNGASGGEAVKINGRGDRTFVRFGGVTADEAGQYELIVRYFCDQDRDGFVSVNDGSAEAVTFPSLAEGDVDSVSLTVDLPAGDSTITVGSTGGAPLFIDQITVTG